MDHYLPHVAVWLDGAAMMPSFTAEKLLLDQPGLVLASDEAANNSTWDHFEYESAATDVKLNCGPDFDEWSNHIWRLGKEVHLASSLWLSRCYEQFWLVEPELWFAIVMVVGLIITSLLINNPGKVDEDAHDAAADKDLDETQSSFQTPQQLPSESAASNIQQRIASAGNGNATRVRESFLSFDGTLDISDADSFASCIESPMSHGKRGNGGTDQQAATIPEINGGRPSRRHKNATLVSPDSHEGQTDRMKSSEDSPTILASVTVESGDEEEPCFIDSRQVSEVVGDEYKGSATKLELKFHDGVEPIKKIHLTDPAKVEAYCEEHGIQWQPSASWTEAGTKRKQVKHIIGHNELPDGQIYLHVSYSNQKFPLSYLVEELKCVKARAYAFSRGYLSEPHKRRRRSCTDDQNAKGSTSRRKQPKVDAATSARKVQGNPDKSKQKKRKNYKPTAQKGRQKKQRLS